MTSDDTLASSNSGRAGMKKGMIRIPKLQAPKCKLIFTQHNIFHAGLTIAALLLQKMTSNNISGRVGINKCMDLRLQSFRR